MAPGRAILDVIRPGLLTTIQDAGRQGHRHEGVPVAGAVDPVGLAVANLVAGNPAAAAALECTLVGPELEVLDDVRIGLGGADLGARTVPGGRRLRPGEGVRLRRGDRLVFDSAMTPDAEGCRAYVAVAGGVDVPVVLGSRSTSLVGAFGGLEGRPLRAGDVLHALGSTGRRADGGGDAHWAWPSDLALPRTGDPIRVVRAPGIGVATRDTAAAFAALIGGDWRVAPASDRRGARLDGPAMPPAGDSGAGSHGVVPGAVQVTPSGQPLVLLADSGPTGGYPVVALVVAADLGLVAQLRPGATLRFEATSPALARQATVALRATLAAGAAMLLGSGR